MLRQDDITGWNSCCNEDVAVGGTQVNVGLARIGIALDNSVKVKMSLFKGFYHLITHFKTILTDAGSHRGLDAVGSCSLPTHHIHRVLGNSSYGTPPTRMGYGNDSRLGIGKDYGYTIGGIHADDHTLESSYQGIYAFKGFFLFIYIRQTKMLIDDCHAAGVGLARHDKVIQVHAQLHCQGDTRVQDTQGVIAHIVTQVYPGIGISSVRFTPCGRECRHTLDGLHKIQSHKFHHADKDNIYSPKSRYIKQKTSD